MDGAIQDVARIGPNAILQLVPVLDRAVGERARRGLFVEAHVALPPEGAGMLPEDQVIRLHRAVDFWLPSLAPDLLRQAGLATGDYILAHRIPAAAQLILRLLPASLAARMLAKAIAKHAWTFAGSGEFRVESHRPLTVSIRANPLASGRNDHANCTWHAAVFERLFTALVWKSARVEEVCCCAGGQGVCRFVIQAEVRA